MLTADTFKESDFDYDAKENTYSQELSWLQHQYKTTSIGQRITIGSKSYKLEKRDLVGGETVGWWYYEIGGTGKVLLIND